MTLEQMVEKITRRYAGSPELVDKLREAIDLFADENPSGPIIVATQASDNVARTIQPPSKPVIVMPGDPGFTEAVEPEREAPVVIGRIGTAARPAEVENWAIKDLEVEIRRNMPERIEVTIGNKPITMVRSIKLAMWNDEAKGIGSIQVTYKQPSGPDNLPWPTCAFDITEQDPQFDYKAKEMRAAALAIFSPQPRTVNVVRPTGGWDGGMGGAGATAESSRPGDVANVKVTDASGREI